jgi:peptide/nickel transport system substrate-binding protein
VGPGFLFPYSFGSPVTLGPLYARWFQTGGKEGKEPPSDIREVMATWNKGMGATDEERVVLGKRLWQSVAEQVYMIGLVGQSPAVGGVRVVKTNVGNSPERQMNTGGQKCPLNSLPQTFYFKNT